MSAADRMGVICGGPPEAHDGKIVLHTFERIITVDVCSCSCDAEHDEDCTCRVDRHYVSER